MRGADTDPWSNAKCKFLKALAWCWTWDQWARVC